MGAALRATINAALLQYNQAGSEPNSYTLSLQAHGSVQPHSPSPRLTPLRFRGRTAFAPVFAVLTHIRTGREVQPSTSRRVLPPPTLPLPRGDLNGPPAHILLPRIHGLPGRMRACMLPQIPVQALFIAPLLVLPHTLLRVCTCTREQTTFSL